MSGKSLPIEIISEIISRLPVKTLISLRLVCKSWYFLISDPTFIDAHLKQSVSRGNSNRFILYMSERRFGRRRCTLICNETFEHHSVLELQLAGETGSCTIVGSVNGLLCVTNTLINSSIYICNPSIRVFRTIRCSCPSHASFASSALVIHGFGYDPKTNDYKVVRILFPKKHLYCPDDCEVEVYTLSTNYWKTKEVHFPWIIIDSAKFLNGCIHWMATNGEQNSVQVILAFEVGNEVFREIMLPNYRANNDGEDVNAQLDLSIGVVNESLALFVYPLVVRGGDGRCYLWVMREYGVVESWTRQQTVELEGVHKALSFTRYEELLLEDITDGDVCLVDFKNGVLKYLGGVGRQGIPKMDFVHFMESLVLLEGNLFERITHDDKRMEPPGQWEKGSTSGENGSTSGEGLA